MKREDIKNVFDKIEPDISAKERMLENILNHSAKRKENARLSFNFRKAVPALALTAVFAVGILTYGLKGVFFSNGFQGDARTETAQDMIGPDSSLAREDMVAPLLNQFQIVGRHYILMSDYAREFGFPDAISDQDIGPKLATIENSPDKSLVGCEVYSYLPAGCEAVVAVKRNNAYELFRFFTFESYNNNQDEDAIEYLKLYGINSPEDIAKIQFIVYSEKSKLEGTSNTRSEITDRNEIAEFYNYYSVLKNSSDRYFEKLFGYNSAGSSREIEIDVVNPIGQESRDASDARPVEPIAKPDEPMPGQVEPIPPDHPVSSGSTPVLTDMGGTAGASVGTGETSVAPSQGAAGNALADPVAIRIYNQHGVYYETMYYGNIGFISRYEITAEFAAFIEKYIK